jgi:putative hydrolase of the HAD superfamily
MEEDILKREVHAIAGARELLASLRTAGIRTALVCDTGFTPGRVVRSLLARLGMLEHLEAAIFSDEIGVPKPHPRAFASALSALGTVAEGAVHVGDLRRSDVAGAQAAGMTSVRFRGHHDDGDDGPGSGAGVIGCSAAGCTPPCPRPEADAVVDTYAELAALLGLG